MAASIHYTIINDETEEVDESSENDVLIQNSQSCRSNKTKQKIKQKALPLNEQYDSYGTTKLSDQPLYADFLPTLKQERNGVIYCRMCEESNHQLEYQQEVDFSHCLYHAQCGDRPSQVQVARYFLDGQLVEQNLTLAITWLIQASKAQYDPATQLLQQCYDHQIGIDDDNVKDVLWCIKTSNRLKGLANREEVFLKRIAGNQQYHQHEQASERNDHQNDSKDRHRGLSLLQIAQQFRSQQPTEHDRVQSQLAKQREKCSLDSNTIIDKLAAINYNKRQTKELNQQQMDKNQASDREEEIIISSSSSSNQHTSNNGGLRLRLKEANMSDYQDNTDKDYSYGDDLIKLKPPIKND